MARDRPHRVASLVASEKMSATEAVFPILPGLSTNTISKMIIAGISGGRSFALRVIPGLIIVVLAAWAGTLPIALRMSAGATSPLIALSRKI